MAAGNPMRGARLALRAAVKHHRRYHHQVVTAKGIRPGPVTGCGDVLCRMSVARYLAASDVARGRAHR